MMYVNASSLNLRAEPSMVGELLMRLQANQRVIVLEVCDDPEWVHVKTDVVEGYCMVSYLAEEGVKPTPTAQLPNKQCRSTIKPTFRLTDFPVR